MTVAEAAAKAKFHDIWYPLCDGVEVMKYYGVGRNSKHEYVKARFNTIRQVVDHKDSKILHEYPITKVIMGSCATGLWNA